MKASAPRYGFRVYLSDAGYVCIEQMNPDTSMERIVLHHDEVLSVVEALQEVRQQALDYVPPPEMEADL